jgi:hypothetical protein
MIKFASSTDPPILETLSRDFEKANRMLIPNFSEWNFAGKILTTVAQKHRSEKIGPARLTNDAFIATSTGRNGFHVITTPPSRLCTVSQVLPASIANEDLLALGVMDTNGHYEIEGQRQLPACRISLQD